ncbi:hypothetical protein [Afifella pfennigii]|uniref:hypothetical protein n=1 Tax=Afifella pfennigii TaxID=209897 RepID=UPI000551D038|nr:hypothetical protein [Afifella pfennigii]
MRERIVTLEYAGTEDEHGIVDGLALARELIRDAHKLVTFYAGPDAPCSGLFEILMAEAFSDNAVNGMPCRVIGADPGSADYENRRRAHLRDAQTRVAAVFIEGRTALQG